jgi:hypothetical protein
MQKTELGQETPPTGDVVRCRLGKVQLAPSQVEIPLLPPETQNVPETHEIASTDPQSPAVRCQTPSARAKEFPSASINAQ